MARGNRMRQRPRQQHQRQGGQHAQRHPQQGGGGRDHGGRGAVPFTSAAHEHVEQAFDVTVTPGAAATQLGPFDVPAFGYLRHIFLEVTGTGGVLGTGTLGADYPHNLFQSIVLSDVNGAPMFGPLDGYATLWTNIVGGYAGRSDPRLYPWHVATINAAFGLRVPVEISHRTGFGALANQNAAAAYKLSLTVNPFASMMAAVGTATAPAFRIRGYAECWTLPNDRDVTGRPQEQLPPGHGTTQYWSQFIKTTNAGANTVLLPRVGSLIRALLFISRTAAGARQDNVFPEPIDLVWDARTLLHDSSQNYRTAAFFERCAALSARDTGVFVYDFTHSDHNVIGDDDPSLWLPTVQSTRLELDGSSVTAGTIQAITCDVAPAEIVPPERFVETSDSGFHPQVGVSGPAVQ